MAQIATGEKDRRLFKILRGSYSRREGDLQPFIDPETGNRTKRKSRPFMHYSAKSMRNPGAKDEVYMTDAEARAFGRHNLRELVPKELRVREVDPETVDQMLERELPDNLREKLDMLIEEGQLIRKSKQLQLWRKRVLDAEVVTVEIPNKRQDVIALLQNVEVT